VFSVAAHEAEYEEFGGYPTPDAFQASYPGWQRGESIRSAGQLSKEPLDGAALAVQISAELVVRLFQQRDGAESRRRVPDVPKVVVRTVLPRRNQLHASGSAVGIESVVVVLGIAQQVALKSRASGHLPSDTAFVDIQRQDLEVFDAIVFP